MRTFNPWDGCAFDNVLYTCRDYLPLQRFWSKLVVITIPCESYISLPTSPRFCPFIAFNCPSLLCPGVSKCPPTPPCRLHCGVKQSDIIFYQNISFQQSQNVSPISSNVAEFQKRADQSVLFFLVGANFWEKHAKNRRKHAKTGEKQALFWC